MEFDVAQNLLSIGVRELCAIACASGDINSAHGAMEITSDNHKLLMSRAEGDAETELPLETVCRFEGFDIMLRGRADIVHQPVFDGKDGELPAEVEEIKTVTPPMLAGRCADIHIAQVKLYALMLCRKRDYRFINCRVTYVTPDGSKTRSFTQSASCEELEFFLASLLNKARRRLCDIRDGEAVRRASVAEMKFPHSKLREGQRELINSVYSAVKNKRELLAVAPTGIGKTVSTLYGAVRAYGEGCGGKIFYLTAKASTRREAYRASASLSNAGLKLRTAVLTSREQCCLNPTARANGGGSLFCNPASCVYARSYYDRRDDAIFELLSKYRGLSARAISDAAEKYKLCPHELSLDLADLCEIVICDYNYAFDPSVKLQRFFGEEAHKDKILLVDEAHNLPERARDIYSAEFSSKQLEAFLPLMPFLSGISEKSEKIKKCASELEKSLLSVKKYCSDNIVKADDGTEFGYYVGRETLPHLGERITALGEACESALRAYTSEINSDSSAAIVACADMVRACRKWRSVGERYDERYRTYIDVSNGNILARQYCLDPSDALKRSMSKVMSAVFFSATLSPFDYFADILGAGKNAKSISLPSPFPRENLFIASLTSVSTRYADREKSAKRLSSVIAATASAKAGNYIVYFPSYKYLDSVADAFTKKYPSVSVKRQTPGMSAAERDKFISFFEADKGKLRIAFCVLGGSFSEGIDLPGDRLIGVIIAGVGLPGLSFERNLIREYFENKIDRGYDYAYTYPGMNRVLQAAGRVIRRPEDRGVVILADDRYGAAPYTELFPPHWDGMKKINELTELINGLSEFWNKKQD